MGRPPLSVGTYGSISTSPYGTGYRARTLYRDYDGVTRRVERHGRTKGGAERALRMALRDRVHVGAEAEITPDTKIAGLAETWFAEISAQDRSPGTLRAYRDRLDSQIIPALGNLRVRELTTGVVDRHLRAVRDKHGSSLAKLCRTVLSGMAGLATRHDALEHNPVRDAGRISPGKPKRVPRALSVAETCQLRAWLSNDDKARERDLPDLVDMLLATGLRVGEALAVTWDAVDLSAGTVEVRGTVIRVKGQGLIIKPAPKTRAGFRTLVLPSWALQMLRLRPPGGPDQTVFCSVLGGLRDRDNAIGDLRNALNAAGFTWVTSHTFRRTVATLMDQNGLSPRAAADQLGHSHPSLTQDVYYGRRIANTGAADVLEVFG
ncbi:MAG TPA: tyrosine-type recombinase/integrase [Propionibacteriaceae bacterium]|nr:tyrosine-type recombinase/integrase [Propionibacteriaceae bacterium]